jgi:hypothetical protein
VYAWVRPLPIIINDPGEAYFTLPERTKESSWSDMDILFADGANPHISNLDDLLQEQEDQIYIMSGSSIASVNFAAL